MANAQQQRHQQIMIDRQPIQKLKSTEFYDLIRSIGTF